MSLELDIAKIIPIEAPASYGLKTFNFYLLEGKTGLLLLDAGADDESCWQALQSTLPENGYTLRDITSIVLTHHHIDHIGLVNRITDRHPVPVYAHKQAVPRLKRDPDFLRMRIDFFEELYAEMGCNQAGAAQIEHLQEALLKNAERAIEQEVRVIHPEEPLFGLTPIHVPGHAPDQIAFYEPRSHSLFGGDLLVGHISSNALVEPDVNGVRLPSVMQQRASLQKCLNYPLQRVYAGHGALITDPSRLIQKRLTRTEQKAEQFKKLVAKGHTTASDLASNYYGETYKNQFVLVMSEVIGHLDYLEAYNEVTKEKRDGVLHYRVAR
ncbi:MBL fold metallo-hydrolase [Shouchella shacheensis]|uniref:MBL fold metallo-hydrolase n=1 Tax=Shouchella shacheensis TaxID=1649580 RepID=UPI00073FC927|nr:MBL fold metallo-hydrolase [Shouchella shacheensis]